MASLKRDAAKEQFWRGAMTRQRESKLSVREFCRGEGLKEHSFHAWRRTIRERDQAASKPVFVRAVVTDQPASSTPIVIELTSGLTLKLPTTLPMAHVAQLVQALEGTPQ